MSANGLWENLAAVFVSYYKYALQVKFSRNLRVLKFPFLIILDPCRPYSVLKALYKLSQNPQLLT